MVGEVPLACLASDHSLSGLAQHDFSAQFLWVSGLCTDRAVRDCTPGAAAGWGLMGGSAGERPASERLPTVLCLNVPCAGSMAQWYPKSFVVSRRFKLSWVLCIPSGSLPLRTWPWGLPHRTTCFLKTCSGVFSLLQGPVPLLGFSLD